MCVHNAQLENTYLLETNRISMNHAVFWPDCRMICRSTASVSWQFSCHLNCMLIEKEPPEPTPQGASSSDFQLDFLISNTYQIGIGNWSIVNEIVQRWLLIHIVGSLIFHGGRVNGKHALHIRLFLFRRTLGLSGIFRFHQIVILTNFYPTFFV